MNKRVLILSTSQQKGAYADVLSGQFIEGTMMNNNSAYQIFLRDLIVNELDEQCATSSLLDLSSMNSSINLFRMMDEADVILLALSANTMQDYRLLKKIVTQRPMQQIKFTHKEIYILIPKSQSGLYLNEQPASMLQQFISSISDKEVKTISYTLPKTCLNFKQNKTMQFAYELGRSI